MILRDGEIKNYIDRFFTKEKSGNGYTTQGYVYLSNEPISSIRYAFQKSGVDGSKRMYIFRMNIPEEKLEADVDEERWNRQENKEQYSSNLQYTLHEFKSCRVPFSIVLADYNVDYAIIEMKKIADWKELLKNCGSDYDYTISNYTEQQRELLNSLIWLPIANL